MPDRSVDRAIDGLARRQHGVFHRRQAVRVGATRSIQRRRLSSGQWVRLARSEVFALPSHPGTWLRQCMASTLSVPAGSISGAAAAALHEVPGWRPAGVEVATRHGTTHTSPFATVRETRTVGRIVVVQGIRVVSLADCLMQIAPLVDSRRYTDAVSALATQRRRFLDELRDRYAALAHSRLPGIANVRAALDLHGDGYVPTSSELEQHLRSLVAAVLGVHECRWEATPAWLGSSRGRVDALVEPARLIIEADGRSWHTRVADFEHDRWRDATALAHGYATLRFTWHQLTVRRTWARNTLAAVVAQRSGSGGSKRAA